MKKLSDSIRPTFIAAAVTILLLLALSLSLPAAASTGEGEVSISAVNLSYSEVLYILVAVDEGTYAPEDIEMLFWKNEPLSVKDAPSFTDSESKSYSSTDGSLSCVFESFGIAPKDLPDCIYAAAHVKNSDVYSKVVRYSPLEYLYQRQLDGTSSPEQQRVYSALLEYATSAQLLLKHDTENTPDSFRLLSTFGGSTSDGYSGGVYKIGTVLSVSADDLDGFGAWVDQNGDTVSDSPEFTYTVNEESKILHVAKASTVTVIGGSADRADGRYMPGEVATVSAPIVKDESGALLAFSSWTDEEGQVVSVSAKDSFTVSKSVIYTANYRPISDIPGACVYDFESSQSYSLSASAAKDPASSPMPETSYDSAAVSGNCEAMSGMSLEFSSPKYSETMPATYFNSFFGTAGEHSVSVITLDLCVSSNNFGIDWGIGGFDDTENRLDDFFIDHASGERRLYRILISTGGECFLEFTVSAIEASGMVTGYEVSASDGASLGRFSLDSLCRLTVAVSFDRETKVPNAADCYIGGSYVGSVEDIGQYLIDEQLSLSVGTYPHMQGIVFLDNIASWSLDG